MSSIPPQKAQLRASEAHNKRSTPNDRHLRNPRSRKAAIDAFCWGCMGGDGTVGLPSMIRECSSTGCCLFRFRPYQKKEVS
jgi:hypothetical protein